MRFRPMAEESASSLLHRMAGKRFLLLNVAVEGVLTSVCVNVTSDSKAGWRRKEKDVGMELDLDNPNFDLTDRTLALTFGDVNALAENFHDIYEALPSVARSTGKMAVGKLHRDKPGMGLLLSALEMRTDDIMMICQALDDPLDTDLFARYRSKKKSVRLMNGDSPSETGTEILSHFCVSRQRHTMLPALREFGTKNAARKKGQVYVRCSQLRRFLANPENSLGTINSLKYLDYELKPLNIASKHNWTSTVKFDFRLASLDLLMSLNDNPVLTEVKMDGDGFVSSAIVQLLYYASILANDAQAARLIRSFPTLRKAKPILCVIAEDRRGSEKVRFDDDLKESLLFLRHDSTALALRPFFDGALVVIIEERPDVGRTSEGVSGFRVTHDGEHLGEHFINWNN
jgi:hypothetical protein